MPGPKTVYGRGEAAGLRPELEDPMPCRKKSCTHPDCGSFLCRPGTLFRGNVLFGISQTNLSAELIIYKNKFLTLQGRKSEKSAEVFSLRLVKEIRFSVGDGEEIVRSQRRDWCCMRSDASGLGPMRICRPDVRAKQCWGEESRSTPRFPLFTAPQ